MVKLLLKTPNIIKDEGRYIVHDSENPVTLEVVEPEGETKKVWKIHGKEYSKKTGTEKQKGVGQGQHWEHAFKLSRVAVIIDESDTYYRTSEASNYLYRKDTLKQEVCPTWDSNERDKWMDTLGGTK